MTAWKTCSGKKLASKHTPSKSSNIIIMQCDDLQRFHKFNYIKEWFHNFHSKSQKSILRRNIHSIIGRSPLKEHKTKEQQVFNFRRCFISLDLCSYFWNVSLVAILSRDEDELWIKSKNFAPYFWKQEVIMQKKLQGLYNFEYTSFRHKNL